MSDPYLAPLSPSNDACIAERFSDLVGNDGKLDLNKLALCQASTSINPIQNRVLIGSLDYYNGSFQTIDSISRRLQDGMVMQVEEEIKVRSNGIPTEAEQRVIYNLKLAQARYSDVSFFRTLKEQLTDYVTRNWDYQLYPDEKPSLSDVSQLHEIDLINLPEVEKFLNSSVARLDQSERFCNARLNAYYTKLRDSILWQEVPTSLKQIDEAEPSTARKSQVDSIYSNLSPLPQIEREPDFKITLQPLSPVRAREEKVSTLSNKTPEILAGENSLPKIGTSPGKVLQMIIGDVTPKRNLPIGTPDISTFKIMPPQTAAALINLFEEQIFTTEFYTKYLSKWNRNHLKMALLGQIAQESGFDANARNSVGDSGMCQFQRRTAEGIIKDNSILITKLLQSANDNGFKNLRVINFLADGHINADPDMSIRFDGPAAIALQMIYIRDKIKRWGNLENAMMAYRHGDAAVEAHLARAKDRHQIGHAAADEGNEVIAVRIKGNRTLEIPWEKGYFARVLEKGERVLKGKDFSEFVFRKPNTRGQREAVAAVTKGCIDTEGDSAICRADYIDGIPREKVNSVYYTADGKKRRYTLQALVIEDGKQERESASRKLKTRNE